MGIRKKTLWISLAAIILLLILLTPVSLNYIIKELTIEFSEVSIKSITFYTTTVEIKANLQNPNPIGVNLDKLTYNIYFQEEKDDWEFLAKGEKEDISIKANGNTTITIPLEIDNIQAIISALQGFGKESTTILVNGSMIVDFKLFSHEIFFERTLVIPNDGPKVDSVGLNLIF